MKNPQKILVVVSSVDNPSKTIRRFRGRAFGSIRKVKNIPREEAIDIIGEDVRINGFVNDRLAVFYHDFTCFDEFMTFCINQLRYHGEFALYSVIRLHNDDNQSEPDEDYDYKSEIEARRQE